MTTLAYLPCFASIRLLASVHMWCVLHNLCALLTFRTSLVFHPGSSDLCFMFSARLLTFLSAACLGALGSACFTSLRTLRKYLSIFFVGLERLLMVTKAKLKAFRCERVSVALMINEL